MTLFQRRIVSPDYLGQTKFLVNMAAKKVGLMAISLSTFVVYCNNLPFNEQEANPLSVIKEKLTPQEVAKEIHEKKTFKPLIWNVCSPNNTCVKTIGLSVMNLSSKVTLKSGSEIPLMGIGTYMMKSGPGTNTVNVIKHALERGYRLIDTAEYYENESDVGQAVEASGIPRSQIFIVTKLWEQGHDKCKEAFSMSLRKLDMTYIDLYLIHSPLGGEVVDSYKAMVEMKKQELIRAIGVSNFGVRHLEELKNAGLPTPEVNQIELHPFCKQEEIVAYCRKNHIAVMGYSPLARGYYFNDPVIKKISEKYGKTPAQIMLRWSVQMAYITIPKTETLDRIVSNANIFDFNLANEDMELLNSLPNKPVTWNPVDAPWTG